MDLPNDQWTLVATAQAKSIIQNTGDATIAFVFAGALPGAGTLLADGEHFRLPAYAMPLTILDMNTEVVNLYARSYGAKVGKLTVYNVAP